MISSPRFLSASSSFGPGKPVCSRLCRRGRSPNAVRLSDEENRRHRGAARARRSSPKYRGGRAERGGYRPKGAPPFFLGASSVQDLPRSHFFGRHSPAGAGQRPAGRADQRPAHLRFPRNPRSAPEAIRTAAGLSGKNWRCNMAHRPISG